MLVPGHGVGFLLDQQRDVGVPLEAVPHTVEVEVEALLPEFLETGLNGGAVEVRADADAQQVGLADPGGQQAAVRLPRTAKAAEGIHQHARREAGCRLLAGLGGHFPRAPGVDPSRPRVGADEVMLQAGLKVLPLSDLLEEGEAHVRIVDGNVARTQQETRSACPMGGTQAGRQESQGAASALEVRNGRPALPHHVDEGGVEGIGRLDAIAERQAVFFRLPALRLALGVGPPHPGEYVPAGFGDASRHIPIRGSSPTAAAG